MDEQERKYICAADCGARCCRDPGDFLVRDDEAIHLRNLADAKGISQVVIKEGISGGFYLDLPCPFLEGSLCGIYDDRPFSCRVYPHRTTSGCLLTGWQHPPQIFIGVPRGSRRDDLWQHSFNQMVSALQCRGMVAASPLFVESVRVDNNRNAIGQRFLRDTDADLLFMVDDDMQFHPDTGVVLATLMEQRALDILGALYFQRSDDFHPHVYQYTGVYTDDYGELCHRFSWERTTQLAREAFADLDNPPDKPILVDDAPLWEVDATGTGCIMIRRRVLEQTPYPWFRNEWGTGGDLMFCIKARRAGFLTHTAMGVVCTHSTPDQVGVGRFMCAATS